MRLRQAKKRLWWSKGEGDYISNHRSKNHHENYKKKYLKLRPEYYDEKRGGWVYPSCADIDIVRRANVRLGRWRRKGVKLGLVKANGDNNNIEIHEKDKI